ELEQLRSALEVQEAKARNAYDAAGRFQADYWAEAAKKQKLIYENRELTESCAKIRSELEATKNDYENQIRKLTSKIHRQKVEIRDLRTENSRYVIVDPGKY